MPDILYVGRCLKTWRACIGKEIEMIANGNNKFAVCALSNSENVTIVVRLSTIERLSETCFRGRSQHKAGNFSRWGTVQGVIRDLMPDLKDMLKEAIESYVAEGAANKNFTDSFEIECQYPVGWSSTDELENFGPDELEAFYPNRRSTALRVKRYAKRMAPQTNLVTLVFEFRHEPDKKDWAAVLHSAYPGKDIGELNGDVTEREQIVFYNWEHPGEM